jgi:hypothetical protein
MFRCSRDTCLEVADSKKTMAVSNRVHCAESVRRVEQDDFRRHLVLDALVDVQPDRRRLIVLNDSFFDADGSIPMLLDTFERSAKSLVANASFSSS